MKTNSKRIDSIIFTNLIKYICCAMLLLSFQASCYAAVILHGNQVITTPTSYDNESIDLTDGRFTVNTGGFLTIKNSTVDITISPTNPFFITLNSGGINLKNSTINVKVSGIPQNSELKALYKLIDIAQGNVSITQNNATIDTPFTVSFLETQGIAATTGFIISQNNINMFHGGLYFSNANNATITDNSFMNVSFSNIYNDGNLNNYNGNSFVFPGNLKSGNAFDIVNSDGITISNNVISSGANFGISIMGGNNVIIDNNKITDSKSYAINIQSSMLKKDKYLPQLVSSKKLRLLPNSNIVISNNYIAQNRFGLTGSTVDNLIVTNNTFIQRFTDSSIRQYWTNNDNLLSAITNLIWVNNTYKEAFTQNNEGDNTPSLQFVEFPAHGGVFIN